jgi:hypothetical protein
MENDLPPHEPKPDSIAAKLDAMPSRLMGALILAFGIVLGKFQVLDPLDLARNHAPEVHYSRTMIGASVAAVVIGLVLLIGGKAAEKLITKTNDQGPATWLERVIMGVAVVIALGLWFWIDGTFTSLGYH